MFAVGWGANQFASLLLAYRLHRGLSEGTGDALFGVYALGLIPALLVLGPISDARGRRTVTCGAAVVSALASCALIGGAHALALLYLGRLLAGLASGAAFAAGTAWVKELSAPPHDPSATAEAAARRAAMALTAGFGAGPLVAGLLAQWAPDPLLVAYLPHLIVTGLVLGGALRAPETVVPGPGRRSILVSSATTRRVRGVVAPAAPWVFVAPSVAFAALPALVAGALGSFEVGFAALAAAFTLSVGVGVQPLARRLDRAGPGHGLLLGVGACLLGLLLAALAADRVSWPLVIPADLLLGAGYGLCLVSGLLEVHALAGPGELASLTAIFYALTYVGFAAPLIVAELGRLVSAPVVLLGGAGLAALVLLVLARGLRRPAGRAVGTL
jgi:hypothetical protein